MVNIEIIKEAIDPVNRSKFGIVYVASISPSVLANLIAVVPQGGVTAVARRKRTE